MSEWRKVGIVGVDAGMVWIGDPCYCVTPDSSSHPAKTWGEFCDKLSAMGAFHPPIEVEDEFRLPSKEEMVARRKSMNAQQWQYKAGHDGLGVTVSSGYGDGTYDVFVREDKKGTVLEAKVVFIDEEDEEEEEDD